MIRSMVLFVVWAAIWVLVAWAMMDAAFTIAQRITVFIAVAR